MDQPEFETKPLDFDYFGWNDIGWKTCSNTETVSYLAAKISSQKASALCMTCMGTAEIF